MRTLFRKCIMYSDFMINASCKRCSPYVGCTEDNVPKATELGTLHVSILIDTSSFRRWTSGTINNALTVQMSILYDMMAIMTSFLSYYGQMSHISN
ncbi:hypothetical protein TNIN_45731 [Trichonephila inaurata madagascariensis]|uniref:Uncharacterized protein n=1 Tax=Trichonephila inaurata madagascariensis TaxID=2747483 RepID=A0A8X6YJP1_9ARAC|nr:hypothetical protein TNIN_45731 [Trichonephila inaurata madagascariensis]